MRPIESREAQPVTAELDAWLARIGLSRGQQLGAWRLAAVEATPADHGRGVAVVFSHQRSPNHVIRVQLLLTDAGRPAFARTASLDISHADVPSELLSSAGKLARVVHAIVAANDRGDLPAPPLTVAANADPAGSAATSIAPRSGEIGGEGGSATGRESAGAGRGLDDFLAGLLAAVTASQPAPPFPTPEHREHLARTLEIADDVRAAFRRDGHVIVRGALDPGLLAAARGAVVEALVDTLQGRWMEHVKPIAERDDTYSGSSTPITHLGRHDAAIRVLTQSPRLAKMAADLMGVPAVRVFCEDWFIKEPRADSTPWHQDSAGMSFDAKATITVWIPLQAVEEGMGPLRFARGSHRSGVQIIEPLRPEPPTHHTLPDESAGPRVEVAGERAMIFHYVPARPESVREAGNIGDPGEEAFAAIIHAHGWPIDVNPPMQVGDVSFHDGSTIHGGLQNDSDAPRIAVALHCFADGAVLMEPVTAAMRNFRRMYAPDLQAGAPAACRFWPLIYCADPASD